MFATEKQLVKKLRVNYKEICCWNLEKSKTQILEEVDLGFGIADLVISQVNKAAFVKDELGHFDILIYKVISDSKKASFLNIIEKTKANQLQVRRSLHKLQMNGYIDSKDELFRAKRSYSHVISKSVAVEAKLKDWKRALNQAFRYRWFASQAFVVLDSKYSLPAVKNLSHFKKMNVGLAVIDLDGLLTVHFKPKIERPINESMSILLSEQVKLSLLGKKK
ncbi:hypothetical protein [Chryseolinea lacunae]|uniref:MarR family transcriptional regulator n=1 Tax=Chryseolinea lacunae TaxID=2801331 RepID=A0ABS1KTE9_9BACT|nr:hypothetical protein [Chryseolinea lacunae]MBL0742741.1 hypothetical protein [Chryseolinea lacunae]